LNLPLLHNVGLYTEYEYVDILLMCVVLKAKHIHKIAYHCAVCDKACGGETKVADVVYI